jgi:hypothetical protein
MPPPSILSTVMSRPSDGGGEIIVASAVLGMLGLRSSSLAILSVASAQLKDLVLVISDQEAGPAI